jgi:hypothetical protein
MTDRKCPLGDDCDLAIAWMAGAEDVRKTYRARLEEMTVQRDMARYEADELIAALQEIELLTATGRGLDPETTMRVHLLAGIGRATYDECAWFGRPYQGEKA